VNEPVAPQHPHVWQRPYGEVNDPWSWLRDRDDPETIAYLEAENEHYDRWAATQTGTVDELFHEIRSRVQETDDSVPVFDSGWWYLRRTVEGSAYPVHCRGRSAERAAESVLLDENAEAAGHDFFALGALEVSPDGRLLAWSSDLDGSERYTLRIRDLDDGTQRDELTGTAWAGVAWASDNEHLFYARPDEQSRPFQIWRHRLGTPQDDDVLVYDDPDERFFVGVGRTRSGEWIVIESGSKISGESWLVPADDPTAQPRLVRPRAADLEYTVDHWGDRFVVVTNLDAEDFRVMTAPLDDPANWTELVAHEAGCRITGVEPFASHLMIHEWFEAQTRLRIVFRDGGTRIVDLGDAPHAVHIGANPEWGTDRIRFGYESFTVAPSVYDEDVRTGERILRKQQPVPNADLGNYVASREWARAEDGTAVPVDVVRRADLRPDGTNPCLVYGYGSYEHPIEPTFAAPRLSLLDRGVVFALVHPRGGGELGRRWYLGGKLLHKRNTFTDTIACAEHLLSSGWAARDRLAVRGRSAGGLLVGACVTMRPDLFSAALAEVPFVDVVSTMGDVSLPLTVTEWEEWGDPRSEPFASYMASYSPYDNTDAADYPALYVTAGLNDPRVSYHEPAKWVAKLRAVRTNDALLVFRCEMGSGHGGASGRYERWRDEARAMAFVLATIGTR
jgi:oligopeptidase B